MEVLPLQLDYLIFYLFLPFLFFHLVFFGLLSRAKIFPNRMNALIALTLSALSVYSLSSLGLSWLLPYLGAALAVLSFTLLYLLGVFTKAMKRANEYITGEAFKTEEEKEYEASLKKCESLWNAMKGAKEEEGKKLAEEFSKEVSKLEGLAGKLKKNLYEHKWYLEYKGIG